MSGVAQLIENGAGAAVFAAVAAAGTAAARRRAAVARHYPAVRREDCVEELHGTRVSDPYRWLEDPDSPETADFVDQQDLRYKRYIASSPHRDHLYSEITKMFDFDKISTPFRRGPNYFKFKRSGLQNQAILYIAEEPEGPWQTFLDPNQLFSDGTVALAGYTFSRDGRYLAYRISASGSDWTKIRVRDVDSGEDLALPDSGALEEVPRVKFSGVSWTNNSRGFFYSRYPEEGHGDATGRETQSLAGHSVYYHRVGTPYAEDRVVFQTPDHPKWLHGSEVSEDGNYLLLTPFDSCDPVNQLYICELDQATLGPAGKGMPHDQAFPTRALVDNFDAQYEYLVNVGRTFYFLTNYKSPRYRVVRVTLPDVLDGFDFEGSLEDVVPERDTKLEWASVVSRPASPHGYAIVACSLKHVSSHMEVFDLNGRHLSTLDLPTLCNVSGFSALPCDDEAFFSVTSMLLPGTVYRYDVNTDSLTVFEETEVPGYDPNEFSVRQEFVDRPDGARVPVAVLTRKDHPLDSRGQPQRPAPCMMMGYGGFGITLPPYFSVSRLVYVRDYGAVFCVANIRGGGEYGEEWHSAGKVHKKQTGFDDFAACGEHLISRGYTSPDQLVIIGGSNGGLLVTACAGQRPDLFAGGIAQVPVTDMLRFHKFSIGYAWASDYGCADNEREFRTLIKYSPLHNVKRRSKQHPAMLVTTADHDDRVVPLHAFKYMAELQHTVGSDPKQTKPLLLRVERKAGHGAGKPTSLALAESADVYACALAFAGV